MFKALLKNTGRVDIALESPEKSCGHTMDSKERVFAA